MLSSMLPSGYDRLQIILSYDTNHTYNFRCLPGHVTKRYMNRHIFKGKDTPYQFDINGNLLRVENEVYFGGVRFPLYERQLYELLGNFNSYGLDTTFAQLSEHVRYIAQMQNIFKPYQSHINIQLLHDYLKYDVSSTYRELIHEVIKENNTLGLTETISAQTLLLLGYHRADTKLS